MTKLQKGDGPASSTSATSSHRNSLLARLSASDLATPCTFHSSAAALGKLPRLVVFDLDYTLWPFWVDTHVTPPVRAISKNCLRDKVGETYAFYADTPRILVGLRRAGVSVAVASRTCAPELARELLKLLQVGGPGEGDDLEDTPKILFATEKGGRSTSMSGSSALLSRAALSSNSGGKKDKDPFAKPRKAIEMFDAGLEIYPSTKLRHMEAIARRTGVEYEDILFFDDEARNCEVEQLGVTMCLVQDGMSWSELERGFKMWGEKRRKGL